MLSIPTYPQPAVHKDKDGLRRTREGAGGGDEDVEVVLGVGREGGEGVMVIGQVAPCVGSWRRGLLIGSGRCAERTKVAMGGGRGGVRGGRGRLSKRNGAGAERTERSEEAVSRKGGGGGTKVEGGWKWKWWHLLVGRGVDVAGCLWGGR